MDQIDLLQEQVKMLAGEVALCTSSLKRLSEQAANNPDDVHIQVILLLSSRNQLNIFLCIFIKYLFPYIFSTAGANREVERRNH